ncbi:hypothetical protein GCM10009674_22650 [Nesterenkonia xinjiangensis]
MSETDQRKVRGRVPARAGAVVRCVLLMMLPRVTSVDHEHAGREPYLPPRTADDGVQVRHPRTARLPSQALIGRHRARVVLIRFEGLGRQPTLSAFRLPQGATGSAPLSCLE